MKTRATLLIIALVALVAIAPGMATAQTLLFDYVGFDYEDPDLDGTTFGELGSGYVGVGFVPNVFAPLVADETNNEYTYVITGLTSVNVSLVAGYLVVDYSPGTISIYEDSNVAGTPGLYGVNPPNATSPSSFQDGTLILQGSLTNFQFVFNTTNNSGSYESDFTATGGSQLGNIPVDQRMGWTFSGATGNASNTPVGYFHQLDGQTFLSKPTPTLVSTWGALKAVYRK